MGSSLGEVAARVGGAVAMGAIAGLGTYEAGKAGYRALGGGSQSSPSQAAQAVPDFQMPSSGTTPTNGPSR